ncbi:zinc finger BED domain-containing protein RICESLEEPER 1-like [Vicia villosa]|uniref:zinc finger BED domain-containing protein RICESLEEPER 1-like n=1 Tax=Vicia villosa TaxID=3911 RepID=UPI00273CB2B1|nr:zinc finger BED domain-containing protein RICESLEEPER 1-like [Vicia villosa]
MLLGNILSFCETFYEAERVKMKRSMALINRLHKRVLSFKNVPPPHSEERDYSGRRNLPLDGKLLVQDALDIIKVNVDKIKSGVKYLLNFETRCKEFKNFVDEEVWPRYTEENGTFLIFFPETNDWEDVHDICKFLEVFAYVTSIISGTSYHTANLFLADIYRVTVLLDKPSSISNNPQVQTLANKMKLKYDKYWPESNTLLSFGVVLDLSSLFQLYQDTYETNDEIAPAVSESPEVGPIYGSGRRNFERFLEIIVANYPVLSKLAKDILIVPVITVASETTFSVGKKIIDPKQSSMKIKTVEVLEEPQDEPLTYHFGEDPGVASSTTTT